MRGARATIGPAPILRHAALASAMLAVSAAVALAIACELLHLPLGGGDGHTHAALATGAPHSAVEVGCIVASVAIAVVLLGALRVASEPPAPGVGAIANAAVWATIAGLAVQASSAAFQQVPGGHATVGALAAGTLGAATGAVHRHAHRQPTYRSFNLVAMLLAAGCLASMSLTSTGAWWALNFSTLGTSGDLAAVCFNAALVLSGGAMAAMSGRLSHGLARDGYAARRGAVRTVRVLIAVIGLALAGVGMVPINADTVLHNVFACAAGAAFAVLAAASPWWVKRMPRALVVTSRIALGVEVAAWVVHDRLGVVSLTVFEVVAFALVFVWLIAVVVTTHPPVAPSALAAPGAEALDAPRAVVTAAAVARAPAAPALTFAVGARDGGMPSARPRFVLVES